MLSLPPSDTKGGAAPPLLSPPHARARVRTHADAHRRAQPSCARPHTRTRTHTRATVGPRARCIATHRDARRQVEPAIDYSLWFGILYVLFYGADTFMCIPYYAMCYEISKVGIPTVAEMPT